MEPLAMNQAMMASAIVLAVTFIGIFTEHVHGFHRAKFAMIGAITMMIVGNLVFYFFFDFFNTPIPGTLGMGH